MMISKAETVNNYQNIENEIKFLPKSLLRMRIINHLHETPSTMSEINAQTDINYSAISNNIRYLELNGYVFRNNKTYYLSNAIRNYLHNLYELEDVINFIDDFFYFFHNHSIYGIPINSFFTINQLKNSQLIENDGLNIYKSYEVIENAVKRAKFVRGILPFYQDNINLTIKKLSKRNRMINLLIPSDLKVNFNRTFNTNKHNINFEYFNGQEIPHFFLMYTDKVMILGLFKNDGVYDQNRLLVSRSMNAVLWSRTLFLDFKKNMDD